MQVPVPMGLTSVNPASVSARYDQSELRGSHVRLHDQIHVLNLARKKIPT